MAMAAAFLVGILLSGAVADWFVRRGVDLLTVMLGFLALFFCAQLAIVLQWTSLNLLMWVVFGMTGQASVLAYPWLSSFFGAALSGRANAAANLVLFLTAFGAQYAIGAIIDLFPTTASGGYDPRGYQVGLRRVLRGPARWRSPGISSAGARSPPDAVAARMPGLLRREGSRLCLNLNSPAARSGVNVSATATVGVDLGKGYAQSSVAGKPSPRTTGAKSHGRVDHPRRADGQRSSFGYR